MKTYTLIETSIIDERIKTCKQAKEDTMYAETVLCYNERLKELQSLKSQSQQVEVVSADDLRDNLINESWMESHQVDECVKWFVANEDIQIIKTIKK